MAGGYVNLADDPFEELKRQLDDAKRRLAELERPTGSQIYDTLATLTDLVNNLADEIANVASSGAVWMGGVSAGSANITTTSGYIVTPAGYALDITYTRRAAWLGNDGRLGWASSSREHKTNIRNAKLDPTAILKIVPRLFNYRAEVEKHKDDPDYKVATEFGAIAEELHDLGLWQVVVYEDGKPVGIHYDLLGLLAIHAAEYVWAQHLALEARVAKLESA